MIIDQGGVCHGMPAGYESPCGVILEPHGPHALGEGGRRAHVIAAIHALAEYLAEHPEHPTPDRIRLERSRHDGDIGHAALTAWAEANGGTVHGPKITNPITLARVQLMAGDVHGVDVVFHQYAHPEERPTNAAAR